MSEKKYVALTFDDGPCIGTTDKVLDVLEEYGVKASFFVIGELLTEETKYLTKRAFDMGCTIENHSKTHKSMPTLSEKEIVDEIEYTTEVITKVTGDEPVYFRPPYIDYDQKMYDNIDLTFICGYGCEDWEESVTADMRYERVMADLKPGSIILLHDLDGNVQTVEAIKKIIPAILQEGYEFVTIRELFEKCNVVPEKNVVYMAADEVRENYT